MVFLFPFWATGAHWHSFQPFSVSHVLKPTDCLPSTVSCSEGFGQAFFPSTTGNYEADPVCVCVASEAADMLWSLKSQSCLHSRGGRRPHGPCRQAGVLGSVAGAAPEGRGAASEPPHRTPGTTDPRAAALLKIRAIFFLH